MAQQPPALAGLSDSFALVRRADVHRVSLRRLLARHRKRGYEIRAKVDTKPLIDAGLLSPTFTLPPGIDPTGLLVLPHGFGGPPRPLDLILTGHVLQPAPSEGAGVLIADVVNNLRSALDHCVWAFSTRRHTPPHPIPVKGPGSEWRYVRWPITLDSTIWHNHSANALRFVDRGIWTEFKQLQPFDRRQNQPERDEFAVLEELWNTYKHRHLPLTQFGIGLEDVVSTIGQPPPGLEFRTPEDEAAAKQLEGEHAYQIVSQRPYGPFEDGAELGRIRETAGGVISMSPQMHMDPQLAIDVAFEQGPPAYGERVTELLARLRATVSDALRSLAPLL